MTLDQLLALFPDNTSGQITAADLRSFASAVALLANNLSDLADAGAARANLGLGTAATCSAGSFDAAGAASAVAAALSPGGSTGALQSNNAGAFADSGWSATAGRLRAPGVTDDGATLLQLGSNLKLNIDVNNDPAIDFAYSYIAEYYPSVLTLYGQGGLTLASFGILASSHARSVFLGTSDDIAGAQSADDGSTPWQYVLPGSATDTATVAESIYHSSTGTPGSGFGVTQLYYLDSSTNTKRLAADVTASWSDATDASYAGAYEICVYTWYGGRTVGLLIQGDSVAEGRGPTVQTQNVVLDDGAGNLSANGFLLGSRLIISGALSDGTYSCGAGSITIANGVITAIS